MPTYSADPRVDAYINALPEWQRIICREVRAGGWRKLKAMG